jgi:peptidoglycan/LPS O-acetylase OafA/YrhL
MEQQKRWQLLAEAKLQARLLGNLQRWEKLLVALGGIGVLLAGWAFGDGLPSSGFLLLAGILGALLAMAAVVAVAIVNQGIGNGRRNVEKLLNLVENR